jgi:hypothetical protein
MGFPVGVASSSNSGVCASGDAADLPAGCRISRAWRVGGNPKLPHITGADVTGLYPDIGQNPDGSLFYDKTSSQSAT